MEKEWDELKEELDKINDKFVKATNTLSLAGMNERLRKDMEKSYKVIWKLEEWLRKEWVNLDQEKHNEGLVKMMKEIE